MTTDKQAQKNKSSKKKGKTVKPQTKFKNLVWGGRPFKKKVVKSKIPNTTLVNGITVVDKSVFPASTATKEVGGKDNSAGSKSFVFREGFQPKRNERELESMKPRTIQSIIEYSEDFFEENKFVEQSALEETPNSATNQINETDFANIFADNEQLEVVPDDNSAQEPENTEPEAEALDSELGSLQVTRLNAFDSFNLNLRLEDLAAEFEELEEALEEVNTTQQNSQLVKSRAANYPQFFTINPSFTTHNDLLDFFFKESCKMFVPTPFEFYRKNPFQTILPNLFSADPTLTNLAVVFGSNHRKRMHDPSHTELIMCNQLNQEVSHISNYLQQASLNSNSAVPNSFLCSILLLSCFSTYFLQKNWRVYFQHFKKLIWKKFPLKNGSIRIAPEQATSTPDETQFLLNWFNYMDVISTLSSVDLLKGNSPSGTPIKQITYKYDLKSLGALRLNLQDIEYFSGIDIHVLYYLDKISKAILISDPKNMTEEENLQSLLDLKTNLSSYLMDSETQRDYIQQVYYLNADPTNNTGPKFTYESAVLANYRALRATNLIFGLNGIIQLNRRILKMSFSDLEVKSLLLKCLAIINDKIPPASPSSQCILSCLFTIGCDLIDDELVSYRHIIMDRLDALIQRGVSAAAEARNIIYKCWLYKDMKNWWEIMFEEGLDISFCL
ncbi:hypothetical protein ACO0QE_003052 [Hanseniaspora vineae]